MFPLTLTPDDDIDVLARRVAHIVDGRAVVEARIGRGDGPQNQRGSPHLGAEGKGARVTYPRHSGRRETCGDLTGQVHILSGIHHNCVVHRQPDHGGS